MAGYGGATRRDKTPGMVKKYRKDQRRIAQGRGTPIVRKKKKAK